MLTFEVVKRSFSPHLRETLLYFITEESRKIMLSLKKSIGLSVARYHTQKSEIIILQCGKFPRYFLAIWKGLLASIFNQLNDVLCKRIKDNDISQIYRTHLEDQATLIGLPRIKFRSKNSFPNAYA